MKKEDLYSFNNGLNMTKFEHPRSTYAVNKNKRQVGEIIEDMEKAVEPDEEMAKFVSAREDLAKKHCEKDKEGNPKLKEIPAIGNQAKQMIYVIPGQEDPESKYRKALAKLEKDYEEAIKKHEEKVEKYNNEFLKEETEYEPFMINLSFLEQHEKCPQNVMDLIFWMVRDDITEPKE